MTIMHSSRMRSVRSSSHVYPSMHWAGECLPRGVFAQRGVYPGGTMSVRGGGFVSQHALGQTPPCGQSDRQV